MKVILAKKAGFCLGVRRAVETTLDTLRKEDRCISTLGPLIHNPQVLNLLEEKGVRTLKDFPDNFSGTVIIRAHGVPPAQKDRLRSSGVRIKDATCPRVVKVQAIIGKYCVQGYSTVIIGDRNHAEVEGLMGYADSRGWIVSSEQDVDNLRLSSPYIIVSQTTQDEAAFAKLSRLILERFPGGKVFNTICNSTRKRQDEVRNLSRRVSAVVVVGGRNSANTKRLGEIAEGMGCRVFMAESEEDLDTAALRRYDRVGVTAGASTPSWMINRVVRFLEALPSEGEGVLQPFFYKTLCLLLASNLYVSAAAGVLSYACSLLQLIKPSIAHALISFGYIFAMHNLNRFSSQKSEIFNDPLRAFISRKFRWLLLISSALSLVFVLTLAYGLEGKHPFLLLVWMSLLGILYNVRLIPGKLSAVFKVRRLKEIPGSKTFFVAMAWAFVVVIVPAWSETLHLTQRTAWTFIFVLAVVYVRSALFDIFDVQGDRVAGRETLPVCLGEEKTFKFLYAILAGLALFLVLSPMAGWMSLLSLWLIPGVFYLAALAVFYEKGYIAQGPKLEFAVETVFFVISVFVWMGNLKFME